MARDHCFTSNNKKIEGGFIRAGLLGCNGGFTLTELMVVVAIIGFILTMGIPAYLKMLPHMRLKSAARDVSSAMQLARMSSIAKNKKAKVTIDYTNNSFAIMIYSSGAWQPAANVPVHSDDWVDVDLYVETSGMKDATMVDDSTIVAAVLNGGEVVFKPNGTTEGMTSNYEAVYMRNIKDPNEYYRVRVAKNTGMIYVDAYINSASKWGKK